MTHLLALGRGLRSFLAVLAIAIVFLVWGSPVLRLVVVPIALGFPSRRYAIASWYLKHMSWWIVHLLTLGGARFRRSGSFATAGPALIVMNHQGLGDIVQVALASEPYGPAYVTRRRYQYGIPLVSQTVRLLGCPIVDPKRNARGSVAAVALAARALRHGLLIFPEGHRSRSGDVLPFRGAGLQAILTERPLPVQLAVTDGLWKAPRFVDLLFRVHLIDARLEVIGELQPPADPAQLPEFVTELRSRIVERLAAMRAEPDAARPQAGS